MKMLAGGGGGLKILCLCSGALERDRALNDKLYS